MITIKSILKIYKLKKKKEVKALDNVSLTFSGNGITFILGKSGSGKSTLLNILGGLDKPTSGELIIDGKNTSTFKESDYDDYRNNYLGFIFQDYNLLDEFNVIDNIELSLKIKNNECNKEKIDKILEELEIKDLSLRKINELSGGQKQRVAIARALVKEPSLILADEPTGALDEDTSLQLMEVLKRLSKDKLIIVVSHNRELASKFGDRIIELKDGKVISDTLNRKEEINESNNQNESSLDKNYHKGKLPLLTSLKIGLRNLRLKKVKLFFTLFLSFFSFTLFGLVSTLLFFDGENVTASALKSIDTNSYIIFKNNPDPNFSYNNNLSELKTLEEEFKIDIDPISTSLDYNSYPSNTNFYPLDSNGIVSSIYGEIYLDENRINDLDFSLIDGKYPSKKDEVALTDFHFLNFTQFGFTDYTDSSDGKIIEPSEIKNYSDLIGKTINIDGKKFKITGFIKTNIAEDFLNKFSLIYNKDYKNSSYETINNDFTISYEQNYSNLLYVSKEFYDDLVDFNGFLNVSNIKYSNDLILDSFSINIPLMDDDYYWSYIDSISSLNKIDRDYVFFDSTKTKLEKNEILISSSIYEDHKDFFDSENSKDFNYSMRYSLNGEEVNAEGKIVGYFNDEDSLKMNSIVLDEDFYSELTNGYEYGFNSFIFKNNSNETDNAFKTFVHNKFGSDYSNKFVINNNIVAKISGISKSFKLLKFGLSICGVFLAIFSMILFGNFISNSISYRKKEIGILRALGCRKIDVFSIFFFEGLAIALINFVLSLIGTIVCVVVINNYLTSFILVKASYLNIGIIEILLLLLISILASTISTYIPTYHYTKKNPFDAINGK